MPTGTTLVAAHALIDLYRTGGPRMTAALQCTLSAVMHCVRSFEAPKSGSVRQLGLAVL